MDYKEIVIPQNSKLECYKCFSIGSHNCYQTFEAPRNWVCETCGNLKFPLIKEYSQISCSWCKSILLNWNNNIELQHILRCPKRPVNTYKEWTRYHCNCTEINSEPKWLLLK